MASSSELKKTKQLYVEQKDNVINAKKSLSKPYDTLEKIRKGVKSSYKIDDEAGDDQFVEKAQLKIKNVEKELERILEEYETKIQKLNTDISDAEDRERRERERKRREQEERERKAREQQQKQEEQ